MSVEEVKALVRPKEETLDLVHEWLLSSGVSAFDYSPARDWINIYIDVALAEQLLDTQYSVYEHNDGTQLVRTSHWSLPLHLHEHIDTIQPTTSFMRSKKQNTDWPQLDHRWTPRDYKPFTNTTVSNSTVSNSTVSSVCNLASVTLDCFRALYEFGGYKQKAQGINKIGFNNYLNETPIRPDLYQFLQKYNPPAAPEAWTFKSIEIAGGPAAQNFSLTAEQLADATSEEANLDVETIVGLTYPMPVYSYSTGGMPPFTPDLNTQDDTNEPYLTWVNYVLGQADVPQVISSSYGDDEQTVPQAYANRVCNSFAQLGARGITLLVSSGDGGVGGEDNSACFSNDGTNSSTFLPAFPASCPFVTAVGATQQFEPEVAAYRTPGIGFDGRTHGFYASGSGFSYYFDRPGYQEAAVGTYVENLDGLYDGLYNKGKHDLKVYATDADSHTRRTRIS